MVKEQTLLAISRRALHPVNRQPASPKKGLPSTRVKFLYYVLHGTLFSAWHIILFFDPIPALFKKPLHTNPIYSIEKSSLSLASEPIKSTKKKISHFTFFYIPFFLKVMESP